MMRVRVARFAGIWTPTRLARSGTAPRQFRAETGRPRAGQSPGRAAPRSHSPPPVRYARTAVPHENGGKIVDATIGIVDALHFRGSFAVSHDPTVTSRVHYAVTLQTHYSTAHETRAWPRRRVTPSSTVCLAHGARSCSWTVGLSHAILSTAELGAASPGELVEAIPSTPSPTFTLSSSKLVVRRAAMIPPS